MGLNRLLVYLSLCRVNSTDVAGQTVNTGREQTQWLWKCLGRFNPSEGLQRNAFSFWNAKKKKSKTSREIKEQQALFCLITQKRYSKFVREQWSKSVVSKSRHKYDKTNWNKSVCTVISASRDAGHAVRKSSYVTHNYLSGFLSILMGTTERQL